MSLKCSNCGKIVETVPLQCAQSISLNGETNRWECDMGNCGIISFDKFLCENCCINSSILKIFQDFQKLSADNLEFQEELDELDATIVQTKLINPEFAYWVEFGGGKFNVGKGETDGANVNVDCSQEIMSEILAGRTTAFSEFLQGKLSLQGNLQYAVVYFDLLNLAAEIKNDVGVIINE
ncbi:MAG: SCP2 sterol-binding domain-containing protein [Promethearchaeota archaeon]|jgi:putative sterol carrier protein